MFLVSKNSELKAKFLFKNKATKSNKNVPSLGSNVVGVVLGSNVAVGVSSGGSPTVGVWNGKYGTYLCTEPDHNKAQQSGEMWSDLHRSQFQ